MKIQQISQNNTNFNGSVRVIGKISAAQKYLFNLHYKNLESMVKDKPYDLFVKQSNSKKTIMLSTDKKFKEYYIVRKNKQNFEQAANWELQKRDAILKKEKEIQREFIYEYVKSKNNFGKLFL